MQAQPQTQPQDTDDGFQRWWLGGAPGSDDLELAASPDDRPIQAAPPPAARQRAEGWVAVAGSIAALALLWGFYGVVDGAVERSAQRQQLPAEAASGLAQASAQEGTDRVHAVYTLPADLANNGAASVHYTRWP